MDTIALTNKEFEKRVIEIYKEELSKIEESKNKSNINDKTKDKIDDIESLVDIFFK